jgi:hypothetical protein
MAWDLLQIHNLMLFALFVLSVFLEHLHVPASLSIQIIASHLFLPSINYTGLVWRDTYKFDYRYNSICWG